MEEMSTLHLQERNQNSLIPNPLNSSIARSLEAKMSMQFPCNVNQESIIIISGIKDYVFLI